MSRRKKPRSCDGAPALPRPNTKYKLPKTMRSRKSSCLQRSIQRVTAGALCRQRLHGPGRGRHAHQLDIGEARGRRHWAPALRLLAGGLDEPRRQHTVERLEQRRRGGGLTRHSLMHALRQSPHSMSPFVHSHSTITQPSVFKHMNSTMAIICEYPFSATSFDTIDHM